MKWLSISSALNVSCWSGGFRFRCYYEYIPLLVQYEYCKSYPTLFPTIAVCRQKTNKKKWVQFLTGFKAQSSLG